MFSYQNVHELIECLEGPATCRFFARQTRALRGHSISRRSASLMTEGQSRLEKNQIKEDMTSLEYVQMLSLEMKIFEYLDYLGLDSWNSSSYKALNITSFRSYAFTAVNQLGN